MHRRTWRVRNVPSTRGSYRGEIKHGECKVDNFGGDLACQRAHSAYLYYMAIQANVCKYYTRASSLPRGWSAFEKESRSASKWPREARRDARLFGDFKWIYSIRKLSVYDDMMPIISAALAKWGGLCMSVCVWFFFESEVWNKSYESPID